MADISPITVARFWSKVNVLPSSLDCWEWKGALNGNGYGNFRIPELGRFNFSAHRVAYMIVNGSFPPEGMVVRHKCDNPKCVNPQHLEYGTCKDNTRDMMMRGRHSPRQNQNGEMNASAKLRKHDVVAIRQMIAAGKPNTAIAAEFGVHHATISAIRRGKTWAA